MPGRSPEKSWRLLHAAEAALREGLGVLELAMKGGPARDAAAADRLARR